VVDSCTLLLATHSAEGNFLCPAGEETNGRWWPWQEKDRQGYFGHRRKSVIII